MADDDQVRPRGRFADVYGQLKADILGGHLAPGRKLKFERLREDYRAGLSPLREALMKLSTERLVEFEEMKGFRVIPVSTADLRDITSMRIELESLALRLSIERGGPAWEAGIVGACHQLSKRRRSRGRGAAQDDPDRLFHRALRNACGSPWLERFCEALHDQSARYRNVAPRRGPPRDDIGKQEAIADAAIRRDAEAAVAALRLHLLENARILTEGIAETT